MNDSGAFRIGLAVSTVVGVLGSAAHAQPRPCMSNMDCLFFEEYCKKPDGECDAYSTPGVCADRPDLCFAIYEPVCGCNGMTYSNGCVAAQFGVNVAYAGECGIPCWDNTNCGAGEYCQKPPGHCNDPGSCRSIPDGCWAYWNPVCGCDGLTHSNASCAALMGVNVAYSGECLLLCNSNSECPSSFYCHTDPGGCGSTGICEPLPTTCAPLWQPVCGCDGLTYENACTASQQGICVAFDGPCIPTCMANTDCLAGHYCEKNEGDCLGQGVCQPQPTTCPDLWNPVCGCDGLTYDNSCFAAMSGASLLYPDTCVFVAADFDRDGDVDQTDFGLLQRCLSGPDMTQPDPACQGRSLGNDLDVDYDDVQVFLQCLSGPMTRPDPDCAGTMP